MTPFQIAGICCLMFSVGIFFWMVCHVLYVGIRRKSLDDIPMTGYAVVTLIACSTGLVLLLI